MWFNCLFLSFLNEYKVFPVLSNNLHAHYTIFQAHRSWELSLQEQLVQGLSLSLSSIDASKNHEKMAECVTELVRSAAETIKKQKKEVIVMEF